MSLIWMEGFDHYGVSSEQLYNVAPWLWAYNAGSTASNHFHVDDMPILGGAGMRLRMRIGASSPAGLMYLPKSYENGVRMGIGFHVHMNAATLDVDRGCIIALGALVPTTQHYWLGVDNDGSVVVGRGSPSEGNVQGRSGINVINPNTLYHFEMQVYHHATEGTVNVRVDGVSVINISGVNTSIDESSVLVIKPSGSANTATSDLMHLDNLFLYDDRDGGLTDWIGPCIIRTQLPVEDVAPQDWVPSSGSDAYEMVNNVPVSPTEYLIADTVDDEVAFKMGPPIGGNSQIIAMMSIAKGRSSNPFPVYVELEGGPSGIFTPSRGFVYRIMETNPDGDTPWTPITVDEWITLVRRIA